VLQVNHVVEKIQILVVVVVAANRASIPPKLTILCNCFPKINLPKKTKLIIVSKKVQFIEIIIIF